MPVTNTIENDVRSVTFDVTADAGPFQLDFPVYEADSLEDLKEDLAVTINGVETTDFSVSATFSSGVSLDCEVTLDTAATGEVTIYSTRAPRSSYALIDGVPTRAERWNSMLNGIVASLRDTYDDLGRQNDVIDGLLAGIIDTPQVASFAAIRALTSVFDGTSVYLIGWNSGSRLGGGFFRYDGSDSTSVDDGGTVAVDTVGRRWKRSSGPPATRSPYDFGAVGDGVTNDSAALQRAFDWAVAGGSTGKRAIDVSGGDWLINTKISVTQPNHSTVVVFGNGAQDGTILVNNTSGGIEILCAGSASFTVLKDFAVVPNMEGSGTLFTVRGTFSGSGGGVDHNALAVFNVNGTPRQRATSTYWANEPFVFTRMKRPFIYNPRYTPGNDAPRVKSNALIDLSNCYGPTVLHGKIGGFAEYGLLFDYSGTKTTGAESGKELATEGLLVHDVRLTNTIVGLGYFSKIRQPGIRVTNTHSNASSKNIVLDGVKKYKVDGCLLYSNNSTVYTWTRSGTTLTVVSDEPHRIPNTGGMQVRVNFTPEDLEDDEEGGDDDGSGDVAPSGTYTVTYVDANTFTITDAAFSALASNPAAVNITAATNANPVVLTVPGHGVDHLGYLRVSGVGGMTQINGRQFVVGVIDNDHVALLGENGTSHGVYTSGGTIQEVAGLMEVRWASAEFADVEIRNGRHGQITSNTYGHQTSRRRRHVSLNKTVSVAGTPLLFSNEALDDSLMARTDLAPYYIGPGADQTNLRISYVTGDGVDNVDYPASFYEADATATNINYFLANTWNGTQTFENGQINGTSTMASALNLRLRTAAGQNRNLMWQSGTSARWTLGASNAAESGGGVGSALVAFAYNDDGSAKGTLFRGERTSGPVNGGAQYFASIASGNFNLPRATTPNGVSGNWYQLNDTQPSTTLGNNPIATTNGSNNVVITWNSHGLNTSTDVNISGASAVGGITLSGWYRITATTTNTITVRAGSAASSTATGGGAAVVVRPAFSTAGDRLDHTVYSSGNDFPVARVTYMIAEPAYFTTVASGNSGPSYEGMFTYCLTPSDNSQLNNWSMVGYELNVVNRGADEGYYRSIFQAPRKTVGFLSVPENKYSVFSGNEGKNCLSAFLASRNVTPNSANSYVKWYQGYAVGPNALVSDALGVGGIGGIGVDINGAIVSLATNPIATTSGSSVVTVTVVGSDNLLTGHNTPAQVQFPATVVVNGVTIAAGSYATSSVTASTFQITGSGSAGSTGSGGGAGLWVAFTSGAPRAPAQVSGLFTRGIELRDMLTTSGNAVVMRNAQYLAWRNGGNSADTQAIRLNGSDILEFGVTIKTPAVTVANLPAAATAGAGARSFVTDATATTFASIVAGGGANGVPVYSDGTNWRIG